LQPFTTALATQMPNYLGYTAPNATYMPLNDNIIEAWDFSHDGQPLPDTLPDLLGALNQPAVEGIGRKRLPRSGDAVLHHGERTRPSANGAWPESELAGELLPGRPHDLPG
jgi:hypothetical protein